MTVGLRKKMPSTAAARVRCVLFLILSFAAGTSWAGMSVEGSATLFTLPDSDPWTTIGSADNPMRWEFRIHGFGGDLPVNGIAFGPFVLSNQPGVGIWVNTNISSWESVSNGGVLIPDCCAGHKDLLARVQRDTGNQQYTFELCDTTGGWCSSATSPILSFQRPSWVGMSIVLTPGVQLAFLRWSRGVVPVGTTIRLTDAPGDLGNWVFGGNGNNSSILSPQSGSVIFTTTPTYPPACDAGPPRSFRAGTAARLYGTGSQPLDGGTTLAYSWEQVPNSVGLPMQQVQWSQTDPQPVVSGLIAGPFDVRLTVTDGSGQTSSCVAHLGAVATDDSNNVITGDLRLDWLLGPMLSIGADPWPWADQIQPQWAARLGKDQGTVTSSGVSFVNNWQTPDPPSTPGTVAVTVGSNLVTGSSTTFGATFCGGPPPCDPSNVFVVIWYTNPQNGRRWYPVGHVTDDTHLTIVAGPSASWPLPTQYALHYNSWTETDLGSWINGSSNNNYYDNVMAFYATYYRTGIEDYLAWARWLADAWWTMPSIDQGTSCNLDGTGGCLFPREHSMTGLVLRALDQDRVAGTPGSSPMWPGLRYWWDQDVWILGSYAGSALYDIREQSYVTNEVALCAAFDPDLPHQAVCLAALDAGLKDPWEAQHRPDGSWASMGQNAGWSQAVCNGSECSFGGAGAVNVMNGASTLTLVSGIWNANWFCDSGNTANFISWSGDASNYTSFDSQYYVARIDSAAVLKLDRPYAGPTATARSWALSCGGGVLDWIGPGTQPFMLGIVSNMLRMAGSALQNYDPTLASSTQSWIVGIAQWLGTTGYNAAYRGPWYGVGFGVCNQPTLSSDPTCLGGNKQEVRELSPELLSALSNAYLISPDATLRSYGDNYYSANFAKYPGDLGYDGVYAQDLDPVGGYFWGLDHGKWWGFYWGFGRSHSWPAARQGGVAPAMPTPFSIDLDPVGRRRSRPGNRHPAQRRPNRIRVYCVALRGDVGRATRTTSSRRRVPVCQRRDDRAARPTSHPAAAPF
jgi:hypothetical protein